MNMVLTRENARPGTPIGLVGGLPPIRGAAAGGLKISPSVTRHAVELVAEPPPKSPVKANLDYLNAVGNLSPSLASVLRPQAAYRWLLPYLAAITPQYVEGILRGALAGNHVQAWELFDLMIDSNPELAACIGEYVEGVQGKALIISPYIAEGADAPSKNAIRNQKIVSAGLRNMNPDPANDENELDDTVRDILFSRFHGQSLLEEDYYDTYGTGQLNRVTVEGVGQIVAPRCTFWVHPVCYAWDMNGRLGLRVALADQIADITRQAKSQKPGQRDYSSMVEPPLWNFISSQPLPSYLTDFPPNKFLISIFKAKAGTALGGSCLRALAAWWVFENFAADYAMDLAQIFGVPFRTAYFDPASTSDDDRGFIQEMLQQMGSRGWAMLPNTVKLDFDKSIANGAESPQGFLIKLCHEQYRKVILRQTMTGSGHGGASSGSKAGMGTEKDVKEECFNAGGKQVCKVLTQSAKHLLNLNVGSIAECPVLSMLDDEQGSLEEAQAVAALAQAGAAKVIPLSWVNKRFNIPKPADGEETLADAAPPPPAIMSAQPGQPGAQPAKPAPAAAKPGAKKPKPAETLEAGEVESPIGNARPTFGQSAIGNLSEAFSEDTDPLRHALAEIEQIKDDAQFEKKLRELVADNGPLIALLQGMNAYPRAAKVIAEQNTQTLARALVANPKPESKL